MSKPGARKAARQRQKKRTAMRRRQSSTPSVLPYAGNKYRTKDLVFWMMATETGILETHVMTGRGLTDGDVREGLIELARQIRGGMPPIPTEDPQEGYVVEGTESLLLWSIRQSWLRCAEENPSPGRDAFVGILRTLLASIDVWGSPSPSSRGYLNYIEDFLGKAGVSVQEVSGDSLPEYPPGAVIEYHG